jgi:hypothetical protein
MKTSGTLFMVVALLANRLAFLSKRVLPGLEKPLAVSDLKIGSRGRLAEFSHVFEAIYLLSPTMRFDLDNCMLE